MVENAVDRDTWLPDGYCHALDDRLGGQDLSRHAFGEPFEKVVLATLGNSATDLEDSAVVGRLVEVVRFTRRAQIERHVDVHLDRLQLRAFAIARADVA